MAQATNQAPFAGEGSSAEVFTLTTPGASQSTRELFDALRDRFTPLFALALKTRADFARASGKSPVPGAAGAEAPGAGFGRNVSGPTATRPGGDGAGTGFQANEASSAAGTGAGSPLSGQGADPLNAASTGGLNGLVSGPGSNLGNGLGSGPGSSLGSPLNGGPAGQADASGSPLDGLTGASRGDTIHPLGSAFGPSVASSADSSLNAPPGNAAGTTPGDARSAVNTPGTGSSLFGAADAPDPAAAATLAGLAQRFAQLADREERLPVPAGLDPAHLTACRFFAHAFTDEILLGLPGTRSAWLTHSLQLNRWGRADGGRHFYTLARNLARETLAARDRTDSREFADDGTLRLLEEPADQSRGFGANAARGSSAPDLGRSFADLGGTPDDSLSPRAASGKAACAFAALCLVFGFRGELFSPDRAPDLEDTLRGAAGLLEPLAADCGYDRATPSVRTADGALTKKPLFWRRRAFGAFFRLNPVVYVLLPLLLAALWYFVCSSLVRNTILPWTLS